MGMTVVSVTSRNFPARLRHIPQAPVVLFVRGDLTCLNAVNSVAVVGTREPSSYGVAAGTRLAQRFGERGWVVVSGLAVGCDTAAHTGCLIGGGRTVAVLAHGLDTIYPAVNRPLADRIV